MNTRITRLQHLIKEHELDALLVTSPYNLRYVAHFTGTTGLAVITPTDLFFVTDARYTQQAKREAAEYTVIQNNGPIFDEVAKLVVDQNIQTIGFEQEFVSYAQFAQLTQLLTATLVPISQLIEPLRLIKEPEELALIQEACHIADQAFSYILTQLKPGVSEIAIANKLDFFMRDLGASGVSFDTIVASGYRSAMPHGVASEKLIEQGDFVTIDFGCYYKGYVSDMTRTVSIGKPTHQQLEDVYAAVLGAQQAVTQHAKAGLTGADLDRVARSFIADKGYGDFFVHSTGHGIGLEVHEAPGISFRNEQPLPVGAVITNEPGIYLEGIGGVRIEDDLVLTKTGNELLTASPRELIVL